MAVADFDGLRGHVGHDVEVVVYGRDGVEVNAAVECVTCGEVLVDFDRTDEEG